MDKVCISIINFNGREDTIACLNSIKKLNQKNFELKVVVIDNGSLEKFDISEDYLGGIPLKIIESGKNLGFSGGHNLGIKYALENLADYVVILNNDTILDENLIYELLKLAKSDAKIGIVVPKIYFAKGFEFHKDRYKEEDEGRVFWYAGGIMDWKNVSGHHRGVDDIDHGQYEILEETDFATGCCMLIAKEVFERVGFFNEKYFLYYEDNDLSQRARKAGFKIFYNPKAILWHKNAGSVGGSGSSLQDYYITRNRMLFGAKFASLRSKFSLIRESFKLLLTGRFWQKRGILDFYMKKFGKGSYTI